jgi:hypothetical protein
MIEKVELRFECERAKESPRDLIVRHAKEQGASGSGDWEVFDQRVATHEDYGVKEPVHAGFRKTFYLGSKHFITRRTDGGFHILEHRQVDKQFFELFHYPDPGPLWDLIGILKRRTERARSFTGPANLAERVRRPTPSELESFAFEADPETWLAVASCACGNEIFRLKYLGAISGDGTLCNSENIYQRADLSCDQCGYVTSLFDATVNGYDAALCGWPPKNDQPRVANDEYGCLCGGDRFGIAVSAVYDADPETLTGVAQTKRNDSFGWFSAHVRCSNCHRVTVFIDYECA